MKTLIPFFFYLPFKHSICFEVWEGVKDGNVGVSLFHSGALNPLEVPASEQI